MGLYESLRTGSTPQQGGYSFQGNASNDRFRIRPQAGQTQQAGVNISVKPGQGPTSQHYTQQSMRPDGGIANQRTQDADRPYAYAPPAVHQSGHVDHWRPPTVGEIMKELGWRVIEAGIQAVTAEIAYFFTKRRFGVPIYQR
jgi:hypothetical protein